MKNITITKSSHKPHKNLETKNGSTQFTVKIPKDFCWERKSRQFGNTRKSKITQGSKKAILAQEIKWRNNSNVSNTIFIPALPRPPSTVFVQPDANATLNVIILPSPDPVDSYVATLKPVNDTSQRPPVIKVLPVNASTPVVISFPNLTPGDTYVVDVVSVIKNVSGAPISEQQTVCT